MSKASIPQTMIRNLFIAQRGAASSDESLRDKLLRMRALQHSPFEQIHYKAMRLRYSMAQEQLHTGSIANLHKQTQSLQKDLVSSRKHASTLEQLVQNLREKASEVQHKHSQEDLNESLENVATLRAQLQEAQSEIETFARQCHLEKETKQEMAAELEAIQGQFKDLKKQVLDAKNSAELTEKAKHIADNLTETLNQKLLERNQSFEELDKEVKSIKELLHEGIRQAKSIEKEYLEAVDEKVQATNINNQLTRSLNQGQEEIRLLKEQLNDAHEREQLMQSETGHQLDQLVRQRDQYRNQLKETGETLESLRRHYGELEQSHRQLSEQVKKSEIMHREQEHEIKTAHQHLAKKVKETTLLSENLEELKIRLLEAQKSHENDVIRINEIRNKMEQHTLEEKRFQEKIHETQERAKEQISKWEEKYFLLAERLQMTEARNKELQALEERHNQMQALLAGLGNFVGNTGMATYTQQPQQRPPEQPVYAQAPQRIQETVPLYVQAPPARPKTEEAENMDLFKDLPQQPRTFKKDFFGE